MFSSVGVPRGLENHFRGSSVVERLVNTALNAQLTSVEHFVRDTKFGRTDGRGLCVVLRRLNVVCIVCKLSSRCRARPFFFSPSVLNTGSSKKNYNEADITKLPTSLGSLNCDTQTHTVLWNSMGLHWRLYAEFQVAGNVCPDLWLQVYQQLANINTKTATVV